MTPDDKELERVQAIADYNEEVARGLAMARRSLATRFRTRLVVDNGRSRRAAIWDILNKK